ncbi:MAG: RNA polymerase sigma factor [Flavobacteriales bacterium]|nr:RNA polymerase sigma factor [Flavobacteriales bacterium]
MKAYEACHEPFVRYCSAIAYSRMDAEDLVQDVLLSTFKNFDKIEKKGKLLHYLIRAAKNRSVSIWRKRKNEAELTAKHDERMMAQGVSADVLLDIQLLYKALDRLPKAHSEALILYEISGFSMKEIAEMQNSTEGAVKTKVSRGRALLREMLQENGMNTSSGQLLSVIRSIAL